MMTYDQAIKSAATLIGIAQDLLLDMFHEEQDKLDGITENWCGIKMLDIENYRMALLRYVEHGDTEIQL